MPIPIVALPENDLLQRLPKKETLAGLEPFPVHADDILAEAKGKITHFFFPISGMISLVTQFEDGGIVEVGCVGKEGLVGFEALLGAKTSQWRAVGQIAGEAYKVPLARVVEIFSQNESARAVLLNYLMQILREVGQTCACNVAHTVEERLARWLLIAGDRVGTNHLVLTHEFISQMLGSRRSTVTVATGILQRSGFIRYKRGHIEILDREGLEQVACECYAAVSDKGPMSLR